MTIGEAAEEGAAHDEPALGSAVVLELLALARRITLIGPIALGTAARAGA